MLMQIPYQTYFAGAQFIHFLLGPAVVALGFPLWERREELKRKWARLLIATRLGRYGGCRGRCTWPGRGPARRSVALPGAQVRHGPVAMGVAERLAAFRRWPPCLPCWPV
ncbi:LrgB family protein [Staphylococcus epidermidis]|nr:LrgB family protein [Staphylococcus epidermidis]